MWAAKKKDARLNLNFRYITHNSLVCLIQYWGHIYTIKLFIIYLKFTINREICIFIC